MRDLYVGDEAVVDCQTFSLDGGHMKGLRQAVNRIAKYGYRMEFYDPARIGHGSASPAAGGDGTRAAAATRSGASR